MSRTLTFVHDGWTVAKRFAEVGRRLEALGHLNRLLASPDLPVGIASEARRLAAEIELERERFSSARRHLRAALALEPGNAEVYLLIGRSFEEDPEGSDERALKWYRKALSLSPASPRCLAACGRTAIRCDRVKVGLKLLREVDDSSDMSVVRVVVDGFLEAGKTDEARRAITLARFCCNDQKELDQLEQRTRFEDARRGQRLRRNADSDRKSVPFLRVVGGIVRRDVGSRPRPHIRRMDRG